MKDDLFNYLVATDELDEFLGYKTKIISTTSKFIISNIYRGHG